MPKNSFSLRAGVPAPDGRVGPRDRNGTFESATVPKRLPYSGPVMRIEAMGIFSGAWGVHNRGPGMRHMPPGRLAGGTLTETKLRSPLLFAACGPAGQWGWRGLALASLIAEAAMMSGGALRLRPGRRRRAAAFGR